MTEPLPPERIQLPAPHLSLYATPDDTLWTDPVTMTHRAKDDGAAVQVREGPPTEQTEAEFLRPPREKEHQGLFPSTFSAAGVAFGP